MREINFENRYPSVRQPVLARNIVATSQPLATQAGVKMLLAGGNAIDAALAAAITLTVVEPTSNGIGSDAFAILWDGKELHGLNASGRSPAGWTSDRYAHLDQMPIRGWDAITVPGAVSAWVALSSRFGSLPFANLFEPAIGYAANGFPVSPIIASSWQRAASVLKDEPGFADAFMPEGAAPIAGQTFKLPAMAETLSRIAETKGEEFYRGSLARKMIEFSNQCGGVMSLDDLDAHQSDWSGTISLPWKGYEMHEIPPNGQGIAALIALGILGELSELDNYSPDSVESIHLQIEAMKLGFADLHEYVSDSADMQVSSSDLLNLEYLGQRAKQIDPLRAGHPGYGLPPKSGTVYLTAADANGKMVSFIQSNYMGFGSGVVVPNTGISLQNRGCGFRSRPGHANSVGPRKRPFHTIIPGFVTKNGRPIMSFGVMGGAMQAQGHVQMAVRVLLHGQDPQTASDAPRWQVMENSSVAVEASIPEAVIHGLRRLGHQVEVQPGWANQSFGGAQLILKSGDIYVAGSDQRKDGMAAGF